MASHTYLLKSRHGVYYFRAVLPISVKMCLGLAQREMRVSLRTKNRARAKLLISRTIFVMNRYFNEASPWEIDAEARAAKYRRGLELIRSYGDVDLNDEFQRDALTDELQGSDLEAYLFAREQIEARKARPLAPEADGEPVVDVQQRSDPTISKPLAQGASPASATSEVDATTDETAERAIERFVVQKKALADPATADKYGSQCRLFLKIVSGHQDNLRLSQITIREIRLYTDTLRKLPRKTRLADPRPIEEIVASAGPRMAPKTVFSHAQAVNLFLGWCVDQGYAVTPPFSGIMKPLLKKPSSDSADLEKNYTPAELRLLFGSDNVGAVRPLC